MTPPKIEQWEIDPTIVLEKTISEKKLKKLNKKQYYVNNVEFQELLTDWAFNKNQNSLNKVGEIFFKIARGILYKPNFSGYTEDLKDDMISDATYYMTRYIGTYDINRNNPFAFFSQIAFNAYLQYLNKYKKHTAMFISIDFIDLVGEE